MALSGIFETEDATALDSCPEVQDVEASADNASVVVADLAMEDDKRERRLALVVGATFAPQAEFIPPPHVTIWESGRYIAFWSFLGENSTFGPRGENPKNGSIAWRHNPRRCCSRTAQRHDPWRHAVLQRRHGFRRHAMTR
jgi:hypothetical protein